MLDSPKSKLIIDIRAVYFFFCCFKRIHRRKLCLCNFKESAIVGINPRPQPLEPYTLPLVYMAAYVLVQIGHDWTIFYLFGGSVQINKSMFLTHFVNFSLVTSYNSCWCFCKWDENNKTTFLMLLRMHIWLELHQQEPGPGSFADIDQYIYIVDCGSVVAKW